MAAAPAERPILLYLASCGVFDEWLAGLSGQAFHVVRARDIPNAADLARSCRPDLLLIGQGEHVDGMQMACRERYPNSPLGWLPAVVLQRDGDVGPVAPGPSGPDDVLICSHGPDIAAVRLRAVLRRERPMALTSRLVWGDLELRHDERRVLAKGHPVTLSFHEFNLLALLLETPGRVWSRQELQRMVGGIRVGSELRAFNRALQTVRRRLTPVLGHDPIQSVRGQGYRLM
jgi:two-component system phosphate regulon response regulator PhoB